MVTAPKTRGDRVRSPALQAWLDLFPKFWEVYPRKVAKQAAEKAWTKLAPPTPELVHPTAVAIATILAERKRVDWAGCPRQKLPHPSTFLHAEKFEVTDGAV